MSQSIPSAALSAANALQRIVGLVFCGCAIGISYATLVIKPRTTNAKVLVWIQVARYLAVTSSVMTGLVALHMTGLSFESILGDYRLNIPEACRLSAVTGVVGHSDDGSKPMCGWQTLSHLQRSMVIVIVDACVTLIEVSVRVSATMAPYIAVDTYLKGLNISVDIFTYCTLGVSINDVLRKSPSLSLSSYAATAVIGHSSGDNNLGAPSGVARRIDLLFSLHQRRQAWHQHLLHLAELLGHWKGRRASERESDSTDQVGRFAWLISQSDGDGMKPCTWV
ncbi:hypothetical protein BCR44DRAFT_1514516 [Catenaria anguillulae PL171]|uniref:Uncharacterized protein n=1 Tax=Catenaria anguillulae PL171 TaxID=765915 RepID=A0A1Y2HJF3_9FUNG|nr:hypothetical protein BCR44DRAFT_1514516 [Catenaria anguillulae PL171]